MIQSARVLTDTRIHTAITWLCRWFIIVNLDRLFLILFHYPSQPKQKTTKKPQGASIATSGAKKIGNSSKAPRRVDSIKNVEKSNSGKVRGKKDVRRAEEEHIALGESSHRLSNNDTDGDDNDDEGEYDDEKKEDT